jgi:hypothetical protein
MSFLTAFISLSPWPKIKQNGGQILRMPFGLIEFLFSPVSIRIDAKRIPSWQVSIWCRATCAIGVPEGRGSPGLLLLSTANSGQCRAVAHQDRFAILMPANSFLPWPGSHKLRKNKLRKNLEETL